MNNASNLLGSVVALVALCFLVGLRLLYVRTIEMREKRVHPQAASTSTQMAAKLQDVQAADNFRNLFEVPVLFYSLVACSLAMRHTPDWLVFGGWLFVGLRYVHSYIHCTYNKVMHRFPVFMLGLVLVSGMWAVFYFTLPKSAV
jgi:hypothetical protein